MSVSEFIERVAVMGLYPDEFDRGRAGEEERAHSTPELGIDKFLSGTNLVVFGRGKNAGVRVNTVP